MKEIAVLLLTATVGAALVSYLGNRKLFAFFGASAAVTVVPWWEEGCKAVAIVLLPGSTILYVHLVFGALELLYDVVRSRGAALYVGLLSLAVHGLTGGVSAFLWNGGSGLWWAYLASGATHTTVNLLLVSLVLPALRGATVVDSQNQ